MLKYLAVLAVMLLSLLVFPGRTVDTVLLVLATAAWWSFVVWYAVRSKWRSNPYGRNTMGNAVGIAVLLTVFGAGVIFGQYPGYELVWGLVFLNLMILGAEHTYHMERTQRTMLPHQRDNNGHASQRSTSE